MKILITGATSKIGQFLIPELLKSPEISHLYLLSRHHQTTNSNSTYPDSRITYIQGDLTKDLSFLENYPAIDLCLHMAALTHSVDQKKYYEMNDLATQKLCDHLIANKIKKMIFISSMTAGLNAGAYAESKLNAEKYLLNQTWQSLLIIRPAEIVGAGSTEGLDKFANLARKFKIYPWLIANKDISFSPISVTSFIQFLLHEIQNLKDSSRLVTIAGAKITSSQLAKKFWIENHAIPIPIYIPLLSLLRKTAAFIGINLFPKDQIPRVLGIRNQLPNDKIKLQEIILPFNESN